MQPTKINLRDGDRVLRTIEVPFTPREAELLRSIAEEDKQALRKDTLSGSGPIREFYLDWPVPWGCNLLDREAALLKIRQAEETVAAFIRQMEATEWRSVLVSERDKIEKALRNVLIKLSQIPQRGGNTWTNSPQQ